MGEGEFQNFELSRMVYTGLESDPFFDPQDPESSEDYELFVIDRDQNMRKLCLLFPTSVRPMLDDPERVGIKLTRYLSGGEIDLVRDVWTTESIKGEDGEEYFIMIENDSFGTMGKRLEYFSKYNLNLMCLAPRRGTKIEISKLNLRIELPKRGVKDILQHFGDSITVVSLSDGKRLSAVEQSSSNLEVVNALSRNFGFENIEFTFHYSDNKRSRPWVAITFLDKKE